MNFTRHILICLLLLTSFAIRQEVFANAAAPGIFQAGGTGTYSFYHPEDSLACAQIQMSREEIHIDLYKGFAVVHGSYYMYNHADTNITLQRTGYPVNTFQDLWFSNNYGDIHFDDLYDIRVLINGQKTRIAEYEEESGLEWYVWSTEFAAQDTTRIEVFFIVNTNDAHVREGYNKARRNAFVYVLASGAAWKDVISKGAIYMRLMDGLDKYDIEGGYPSSGWLWNEELNTIRYAFVDRVPNAGDNLVVTFGKHDEDFDFGTPLRKADQYYKTIKDYPDVNSGEWEAYDMEAPLNFSTNWFAVLMGLLIIGVPLLAAILGVFIIYRLFKKSRSGA